PYRGSAAPYMGNGQNMYSLARSPPENPVDALQVFHHRRLETVDTDTLEGLRIAYVAIAEQIHHRLNAVRAVGMQPAVVGGAGGEGFVHQLMDFGTMHTGQMGQMDGAAWRRAMGVIEAGGSDAVNAVIAGVGLGDSNNYNGRFNVNGRSEGNSDDDSEGGAESGEEGGEEGEGEGEGATGMEGVLWSALQGALQARRA
ncbi:hypothetical protein HDU82_006979, partial [Entophlyctis luteolus]